jgi:hypothetical protein
MHRIFESMSRMHVRLSSISANGENCSDNGGNDGYAEWYTDDPAPMNKVRAGM